MGRGGGRLWEPPKAVMKDSGTKDWTSWGGKLQLNQLLVRQLRVLGISVVISSFRPILKRNTLCPELMADKIGCFTLHVLRNLQVELLPVRYSITSATECRLL